MLNGTSSYDSDGSIVNWSWDIDADGVFDLFGPFINYTYNDDSINNVTLMVFDDQGAFDTDNVVISVLNLNSTISDLNITIHKSHPRTIGYWKHQCNIDIPKNNHTGILPEFIAGVNSNSSVFNNLSSKYDILDYLEPEYHSNMTDKAKQQLLALWLNVVSGKITNKTPLNLTNLTTAPTVDLAIKEIESIILNLSSNRSELERVKDIADSINNGIGLLITAIMDIQISDPGSDDIYLTINWNDSSNNTVIYFNNDPINTSDPYPSQFIGNTPMKIQTYLYHNYYSPGNYLISVWIRDDDNGITMITKMIMI
jgi:hypothetical protein